MYKKIVKNVIVCISVVFFSLIMLYVVYYSAANMINKALSDGGATENAAEAVSAVAVPEDNNSSESDNNEYYLARLNGDRVEIFSCAIQDGGDRIEKFLYSFLVYAPDIPTDDLAALKQGIRLSTKEELISFEEDFNS